MEKIDNSLKLKILFLLVFSNISIYMLASTPDETSIRTENIFQERIGYTDFKLKAQLLTSFAVNKPITIISKDKRIHIPFALLKSKISHSNGNLMMDTTISNDEFIVYLPESYIPQLLQTPKLSILPFGKNYHFPKRKRSPYEIHI